MNYIIYSAVRPEGSTAEFATYWTQGFVSFAPGGTHTSMFPPYEPVTKIDKTDRSHVEVKKYVFTERNGRTLDVYYAFPPNRKTDENTRILITMHGSSLSAAGSMHNYKHLTETENLIVISPEFARAQFPQYNRQYSTLDIGANINKPENWTSKIVDAIFLDFIKRYNLPYKKYILLGYSAGGQFAARATMFDESPYRDYTIAAGAGRFTLPDDRINYEYGIKNILMHKDVMDRNFAKRMYILSGDRDRLRNDPRYEEYHALGPDMHSRHMNWYAAVRDYCEENGLPFNWDFVVMGGVGHVEEATLPWVTDIIKGIYDERQPAKASDVYVPSDAELASQPAAAPNPGAAVGPLLKTRWGQGAPYNNLAPMDGDKRPPAGCATVAVAQVMAFHKYPPRGVRQGESEAYTGRNGVSVPPVNFNVAYDWANMLDSYRSDGANSNEQQRNAVATLMYHVGVSMQTDYSAKVGSANRTRTSMGLVNYFGYDRNIEFLSRWYFEKDAEWEAIIRSQLVAGLPVIYSASSVPGGKSGNHTFVIDGYDNAGRFHINYGWGGGSNGWYSLNDQKFRYNPRMTINVKPDKGGTGTNKGALTQFTVNKTSVSQNETFAVDMRITGTGFFSGGQAGVALADNKGDIASVIATINYDAFGITSSSRRSIINCFVPKTVKPGQYSLRIVLKPSGKDWEVVTLSEIGKGVPSAIPFTVTEGAGFAIDMAELKNGGGYGLALEQFLPNKISVSHDESFEVRVGVRNPTSQPFGGQLGVALLNSGGDIVEVVKSAGWNTAAGTTGSIGAMRNCTVPATVPSGQYLLCIVVRPTRTGEWRIATEAKDGVLNVLSFTVR